MAKFDTATGRYVYLDLDACEHRVYFETTGKGIPMLLQHTAGADARQWRHVLEDPALQERFQMIAYDLPYHGKSVPPTNKSWWTEEYRLTRDFLMSVPVGLAAALELERPVYMGSSIGGHLAIDLAISHPDAFRAVVGLEASAHTPGGYMDEFYHPGISNDFKAHMMYTLMAPTSPEPSKRETIWVYSQGAPAVFKGDLYYYSVDHDVRENARQIDTNRISVDILNGEYDWSGTPAAGEELAGLIPGARYQTMSGLGHFPMSEHPEKFLDIIRPVLERIASG
ncbi:MAG: alpha/beta hydrolase [Gammaproteobacteria bacterium]|nr:MAG: alpha/beta hydrolase [Gammaproteobacteria bacterium]